MLLLIILCFIFNLNKEAFANGKNEGGDKSHFMESFMKNMEVDLKLSYVFLYASPLHDERLQSSLPNLRVVVAETDTSTNTCTQKRAIIDLVLR